MTEPQRPVIILSGGRSVTPLFDVLARDFDLCIYYPQVAEAARLRDLPVFPLSQFYDPGAAQMATNAAAVLTARAVAALERGAVQSRLAAALNSHAAPILDELNQWLPGYVMESMRRQTQRVAALDRLAAGRRVAAVVLHNDVEEDMADIALWAAARRVPCLHVPHAVYIDDATRGKRDIHDRVIAPNVAASGPFQRAWYERRGAKMVRETGLPQWDMWARFTPDRKWARAIFRLSDERPVILYCSSWDQYTSLAGISCGSLVEVGYDAMLDAARAHPEWQLVVKVHPSSGPDHEKQHGEAAKAAGVRAIVTRQYLPELLAASDVLVSCGPSNVVVEAALAGLTRLVALGGFEDDAAVYSPSYDAASLSEAVEAALRFPMGAPYLDAFKAKYAGPSDGRAAERVGAWVREMAGL